MFVSPCLRRNRLAYGHASANQSQKQTRTCTSRMLRQCRFICPHYNPCNPQKPCTSRMLQHRHLLFTYTCAHTEGCANACSDAHAHIQNAHYWTCKRVCAHTKCRATAPRMTLSTHVSPRRGAKWNKRKCRCSIAFMIFMDTWEAALLDVQLPM